MSILCLVLGGSRSGKSARGEALAAQLSPAAPVVYVATCRSEGLDSEMQSRIQKHQDARPADWITVENEFDLAQIAADHAGQTILIDCLTLWLSHWSEFDPEPEVTLDRLRTGLSALAEQNTQTVIVSNELGGGLIPMEAASRAYRDLVGTANQIVAAHADEVEFVIAGLPTRLKSRSHPSP
ncbi:MAG: bifunctional adenosylcobinamide kinase/adenosylcobinamide-phosphate guanylyltransferase [Verrucomicrobiota bacterium]